MRKFIMWHAPAMLIGTMVMVTVAAHMEVVRGERVIGGEYLILPCALLVSEFIRGLKEEHVLRKILKGWSDYDC